MGTVSDITKNCTKILHSIRIKIEVFWYNFAWPKYMDLIDGWLPRCAIFLPLFGYLIIFNDEMVTFFQFEQITSKSVDLFFFGSVTRMRFIYFGMLLLGFSNLLYRLHRPWVMRYGKNQDTFMRNGLSNFSPEDYFRFHNEIRYKGHLTSHGKYYDSEWEDFCELAVGSQGNENKNENRAGNWSEAKAKFEPILRNVLAETYFRSSRRNRITLCVCIAASFTGLALFLIPSLDLMQAVVIATLHY